MTLEEALDTPYPILMTWLRFWGKQAQEQADKQAAQAGGVVPTYGLSPAMRQALQAKGAL